MACQPPAATPSQGRLLLLSDATVNSSLHAGLMYNFKVGDMTVHGLFAMVLAEALCADQDPHVLSFSQFGNEATVSCR